MTAHRVRQIVTAVADLESARSEAETAGLPFVYQDPGVGHFGAVNSLHAAGDTFVELLAERDAGSPVGRHLGRLGGDGGYMVIVQVDDLDEHLARVDDLGVRVVWSGGIDGIRGAHLHPVDVGGAILSVDEADPAEAWPWCGPTWTGGAPATTGAPIDAITLTSSAPERTAERWAAILGVEADGASVSLPGTRIDFVEADDRPDRLVSAHVPGLGEHEVGGLRLSG